ncbi:MAG: energy-coupled thiamine transporter ThiT [Defluviitaleaceae bacterium]|nr:energy-coupled thiamine transporter ThiT [Defluviitaleaceae bacterium]MCL2836475.1 energy-coupled thiamine transporter ThiT [Defluviitaleaceae bacterium]
MSRKSNLFTPQVLTASAVCLAIAAALSMMPMFRMPQGGSVTPLCMLFIALPGYFFGPAAGFTAAISFSILRFIIRTPDLLHPAAILLDYILGYGAIGVAGFFQGKRNGLFTGYGLGVLGRFAFSTISGYVFYRQWAPEGQNPWAYSSLYQISYLGPEVFITVLIISIPVVQTAIERVNTMLQRKAR